MVILAAGLLGWIVFFIIEGIYCIFFSGKYGLYYLLSFLTWIGFGLISTIGLWVTFHVLKLPKLKRTVLEQPDPQQKFGLLSIYTIAPLFFYTFIQSEHSNPSTLLSLSSLGIIGLLVSILFAMSHYIKKTWRNLDGRSIFHNFLLFVFFSALMSILGLFSVTSMLQPEHFRTRFLFIFIFCIVTPFAFLFILNRIRHLKILTKYLLFLGMTCILIVASLRILSPIVERSLYAKDFIRKSRENSLVDPPNILLIVMDTARAANMSLYGYERPTTPSLKKFAQEGIMYTQAISPAPWTLPAHASLFTGHFSSVHGATHGESEEMFGLPLHEEFNTLAEILSSHGYDTFAAVSNTAFLAPHTQLNQGFEFYWWGGNLNKLLISPILWGKIFGKEICDHLHRLCGITEFNSIITINQKARKWLDGNRTSPWFMFLNYMEVHGTNYLPSPFASMFTSPPYLKFPARDENTGLREASQEDIEKILGWYDNEMTFLDHHLGIFLSWLKAKDYVKNTVIIITSDHGELLGEHKDFGHTFWLYDLLLRVPLIVKSPNQMESGIVNHKAVQLNDIFAEILFQAGIDIPEFTQGQPLNQAEHPIIAEVIRDPRLAGMYPDLFNHDLTAIYSKQKPGIKLISSSQKEEEVYDLASDSFELFNIMNSQEVSAIKNELFNYLSLLNKLAAVVKPATTKKKKMDAATIERLRSLGYLK